MTRVLVPGELLRRCEECGQISMCKECFDGEYDGTFDYDDWYDNDFDFDDDDYDYPTEASFGRETFVLTDQKEDK